MKNKPSVSFVAVLLLLLSSPAFGGNAHLCNGLTLWAPFTNQAAPMTLYRGTGSLTISRTHDATHTATYIPKGSSVVTTASSDQGRIEENGIYLERPATNLLLRSRAFDNAVWVKTNTTVAANQTGEDGVDNTAHTLTATGANGTICQAVTADNVAYSGVVSVKRITGTGAVQVSIDNGATWGGDVAGSLSTSSWYRAGKNNQTLPNPELCLRLAASGDAVAIDYAQLEAGEHFSSRIPTDNVAMSRNGDVPSFPATGNFSNTLGAMAAEVTLDYIGSSSARQILGTYMPMVQNGSDKVVFFDLANAAYGAAAFVAGVPKKVAGRWSVAGGMGAIEDGGAIGTSDYDGAFSTSDPVYIGSAGGTSDWLNGHVKNVLVFNFVPSDGELTHLTVDNWTGDYCHNPVPDFGNFPSFPRMR